MLGASMPISSTFTSVLTLDFWCYSLLKSYHGFFLLTVKDG